MSLRIAEQRLGRRLHGGQAVPLLGGQVAVEGELGHADDAVHRRADLVAHVREELALRPARLHRLVACIGEVGVRGPQFGHAIVDCLLEVVLLNEQLPVAPLDFRQHLVEAVDQLPDLVVSLL